MGDGGKEREEVQRTALHIMNLCLRKAEIL